MIVAIATLLIAPWVFADDWMPPQRTAYYSSDKTWRLIVTPRPTASPLAYFKDKVAGRANAGAVSMQPQTHAWGVMQHLGDGQWHIAWAGPLLNEIAPATAIVSPSGLAVTFNNWYSNGYGNDAVVIYDNHGMPVRAMALKDFLPAEYIKALPHSVSSIWWGGDHHFSADGRELLLRVVVPSTADPGKTHGSKAPYIELGFSLTTGKELPPHPRAWSTALAAAKQVDAMQRAEEAKQEAAFRAPLTAPRSDAQVDWHQYLRDAFFRIDPDWNDTFPGTQVLPRPNSKDYPLMLRYLKEAFHDDLHTTGVLMIASPSQDNLVRVLTTILPGVPDGWFKHARIYVAVDDAHNAAVVKLLAHTGAQYVQLNPNHPIPQRKARLDIYQAPEQQ